MENTHTTLTMTRKIRTTIKPLSSNKAYKGRKFRTYDYNKYRKQLLAALPSNVKIPEGELILQLNVYYSNRASDITNCLKPFEDILQEKYGFNDNRIYHTWLQKIIVPKGEEGILFKIKKYKGEIKW